MAIRTTEKDVPTEFPPARLFLDDIGEIIRILFELVQSQRLILLPNEEEPRIEVVLSTGDEECDDVQDLPKIAKSNRNLSIEVRRGNWVSTSLTTAPWSRTRWWKSGFTNENTWSAYRKLESLFNKRKLRWRAWVHPLPSWLSLGIFTIGPVALLALGILLLKFMPRAAVETVLLLFLGALITAGVTSFRHATLTLRNSWDPSPFSLYLKDKIIPVIVGAVAGALLTLLGLYLKHKYWP
jgi:hypothetical protein